MRVQIVNGNFTDLCGTAFMDMKDRGCWVRLDILPDYLPMQFNMNEVMNLKEQT